MTKKQYDEDNGRCIRIINDAIDSVQSDVEAALKFSKMKRKVKIVAFADESFAGNNDLSSQAGYVIFVMGEHGNAAPLA